MFYDDGYDPDKEKIKDEEFRLATESEIKEGRAVRVFKLSNGDVFQIYNLLLEFEDNILYEVVCVRDTLFEPRYERTGRSFTPEQINKMIETKELS
jgi:hypothetical protein